LELSLSSFLFKVTHKLSDGQTKVRHFLTFYLFISQFSSLPLSRSTSEVYQSTPKQGKERQKGQPLADRFSSPSPSFSLLRFPGGSKQLATLPALLLRIADIPRSTIHHLLLLGAAVL